MPKLIVCNKELGHTVFALEDGLITIGRGNEAELSLPNVSVSREHARIHTDGDTVQIEDLESRNKTIINGEAITKATLKCGDEILLGKYLLIYLDDDRSNQFFRGRYTGYMKAYEPRGNFNEDSTFAISPAQMLRMQREQTIIRNAKVVSIANPSKFWHPEDRTLTFGGDGMIPVEGWLHSGIVADLTWDGQNHVIHKLARLAKVLVNDKPVTSQALQDGDRIRIGSARLRYESPDA
jgi:hypothetical protein